MEDRITAGSYQPQKEMGYQKYYVPESSKFPIFAAFSLFILIIGASSTINSLDNPESNASLILYTGLYIKLNLHCFQDYQEN